MRTTVISAALAAVLASVFSAQAAMPCYDRDEALAALGVAHDEMPVGQGLMDTGSVLELLVSPDGSFTVLVTLPDDQTCAAAAGENWEVASTDAPAPQERVELTSKLWLEALTPDGRKVYFNPHAPRVVEPTETGTTIWFDSEHKLEVDGTSFRVTPMFGGGQ